MYSLIYAADHTENDYRVIETEINKITLKEFVDKCKLITKEYHPVRFIVLEDDDKGIVAMYNGKQLTINRIWKTKNEV
jgi:hypothetical protein